MGSGSGPPQQPPGRPKTDEASISIANAQSSDLCPKGLAPQMRVFLNHRILMTTPPPYPPPFRGRDRERWMGIGNESNQDKRAISTGKLNALPRLHTRPINVVVYHGS